jgi:hypothetical protein
MSSRPMTHPAGRFQCLAPLTIEARYSGDGLGSPFGSPWATKVRHWCLLPSRSTARWSNPGTLPSTPYRVTRLPHQGWKCHDV